VRARDRNLQTPPPLTPGGVLANYPVAPCVGRDPNFGLGPDESTLTNSLSGRLVQAFFEVLLAVRRMASSANGGYIRKVPCIWLTGIDLLDSRVDSSVRF
jgi:hypothetical protein